jgi:hypothetical protein
LEHWLYVVSGKELYSGVWYSNRVVFKREWGFKLFFECHANSSMRSGIGTRSDYSSDLRNYMGPYTALEHAQCTLEWQLRGAFRLYPIAIGTVLAQPIPSPPAHLISSEDVTCSNIVQTLFEIVFGLYSNGV